MITKVTGHTSSAIRNYKRPSTSQLINVSEVLRGNCSSFEKNITMHQSTTLNIGSAPSKDTKMTVDIDGVNKKIKIVFE